jgi:hypothetical protein
MIEKVPTDAAERARNPSGAASDRRSELFCIRRRLV